MQGGQRKGAGREFTGWAGLTKGIGTQAGRYPNPIPTLLNHLKSEGINVQCVVEALESLIGNSPNNRNETQQLYLAPA